MNWFDLSVSLINDCWPTVILRKSFSVASPIIRSQETFLKLFRDTHRAKVDSCLLIVARFSVVNFTFTPIAVVTSGLSLVYVLTTGTVQIEILVNRVRKCAQKANKTNKFSA